MRKLQVWPPSGTGEWSADVDVSVLTVLLPFLRIGENIDVVCITAINDGANDGNLIVEFSEDGIHTDDLLGPGQNGGPLVFPVAAGKQCSTEIGPNIMRRFVRLSAYTSDPAFPVTQIRARISGSFKT